MQTCLNLPLHRSTVLKNYDIIYYLVVFCHELHYILFHHVAPDLINIAPANRKVPSMSNGTSGKETVSSLLASLMEVVRTTVACECVYVRAMVIKALIWMQSPHESFDELKSIIASELSDPAWPATLLNDVLLTLHARFKVRKI